MDDLDHKFKDYHSLKLWTDRYAEVGELKGGSVQLKNKYYVITSNYTINELTDDVEV
jgi:hypothetical protein